MIWCFFSICREWELMPKCSKLYLIIFRPSEYRLSNDWANQYQPAPHKGNTKSWFCFGSWFFGWPTLASLLTLCLHLTSPPRIFIWFFGNFIPMCSYIPNLFTFMCSNRPLLATVVVNRHLGRCCCRSWKRAWVPLRLPVLPMSYGNRWASKTKCIFRQLPTHPNSHI